MAEDIRPSAQITLDQWTEVDQYLASRFLSADPVLDAAIEACNAAGLPQIAVSATQGKLLQLLVQIAGARSVLEIGTLGGYSTIWLARGLMPGGRLITLEIDPKHAEVARANLTRAGFGEIADVRLGPALDTLPLLSNERLAPFDFVFIDADKANIPAYFEWSLKLSRPGAVIVVDNVVRDGAIIDADSTDPSVIGVRRFMEMIRNNNRVSGTAIQTVGTKGYDGFAIVLVGSR